MIGVDGEGHVAGAVPDTPHYSFVVLHIGLSFMVPELKP